MSESNWRSDPRWQLVSFEQRLFKVPPTARPHVDAERSTDHKWASLYWTSDKGRTVVAATWVLVGIDRKEIEQMQASARHRQGRT